MEFLIACFSARPASWKPSSRSPTQAARRNIALTQSFFNNTETTWAGFRFELDLARAAISFYRSSPIRSEFDSFEGHSTQVSQRSR